MRNFRLAVFAIFVVFAMSFAALAQETQTRVVDEVVAVVNDGVITLSRVKREKKIIVDTYVQEGKKREEAEKMVNEKEGELVANLINEELLTQKAKEMGLEKEIEDSVNQRFSDIMKQYNMKTLDSLYAEMAKQGVDPQDLRENWRKQAIRERVIYREVQMKLYWAPNGSQLKDYFEKHKAKFTKPETISLSEVFLSFAGRDEAAVREKAKQIHAQLKGGADFAKVAKENDPGVVTQGNGKVEKLRVSELVEKLANAVKGLKVGDIAEPFEADQIGMVILRIDEREQASSESMFDENAVRLAMMGESMPDAQKKFLAHLREDALIKIGDSYRPLVAPILFADERKEKPGK